MGVLDHLNVVAPQMGELEGNVGNDKRTRREVGGERRKERRTAFSVPSQRGALQGSNVIQRPGRVVMGE